jgi:hypothetical protein
MYKQGQIWSLTKMFILQVWWRKGWRQHRKLIEFTTKQRAERYVAINKINCRIIEKPIDEPKRFRKTKATINKENGVIGS